MLPSRARELPLNISAYTTAGRRIAHVAGVSCFTAWQCLQASLAARFECDLDEVDIVEDDDGIERLSVLGCVIGYVTTEIGGITFGLPDAPGIVPDAPAEDVQGSDIQGYPSLGVPVSLIQE